MSTCLSPFTLRRTENRQMARTSFRVRLARWLGGSAVKSAEAPVSDPITDADVAVDPERLPLIERVRVIEAEMLDLSTQWSDLNDAVRKWSARLASQKAAETRKALAAMGGPGAGDESGSEASLEAETDTTTMTDDRRAKLKAQLRQRWAQRGR